MSGDCAYELKWDGFRAIVLTEGTLRVADLSSKDRPGFEIGLLASGQ
jgi:ATP-dependent DNA ligase